MNPETKRGRRSSGPASRPSSARALSLQSSGGLACTPSATDPESLEEPPAVTQSTTSAAKALARWENEGGRVLEAAQGGRPPE